MSTFVSTCILFLIAGFPLYLWAYGATRLDDNPLLIRFRFWMGIVSGGISVGLVYIMSQYNAHHDILANILILGAFFLILFFLIWVCTCLGSVFSRGFIRRMAFQHVLAIFGLILLLFLIAEFILGSSEYALIMVPIFLASFFEETTKHMTTLSLLGKEFQFSRRDFTLFAFSVVLGFTFFENLLYFFSDQVTVTGLFFRSIFSFSAHLLAAMICTWAWWKALSYPLLSLRYVGIFLIGFLLATASHAMYNIALGYNVWIVLGITLICAYSLFSFLLVEKN